MLISAAHICAAHQTIAPRRCPSPYPCAGGTSRQRASEPGNIVAALLYWLHEDDQARK
jgi:hypothetical protein